MSYALRARGVRLFDMHSLDRAPKIYFLLFILRLGAGIGGFTKDSVVEDVDFGGARTAEVFISCSFSSPELVTTGDGAGSHFLQYVFNFGIINTLDVSIVRKILSFTLMFHDWNPVVSSVYLSSEPRISWTVAFNGTVGL